MRKGQRHTIKCRCVLPQFKGRTDTPHQFIVFSILDENDVVVVKYAKCNNCGIVHKVTDICKSEIMKGKEEMSAIIDVDDIKQSLPQNLVSILERSNADLPTWEQAQFILENKSWGEIVVLTYEDDSGTRHGKYVRILGESFFKVESFSRDDVVVPQSE